MKLRAARPCAASRPSTLRSTDSPERVEIDFHPVAPRVRREWDKMRKAFFPKPGLTGKIWRNGVTRTQRTREPRPARMLGEMHHELVASRSQHREEPPLRN